MQFTLKTTIIPAAISLMTLIGVVIHDTLLDRVAVTTLGLPAVIAAYGAAENTLKANGAHTHIERASFHQTPRVTPRALDDKKYLLARKVAKGHHPFDNYSLPMV